ncbi:MAG: hypothetical protein ACQESR_24440 [Planctomycetota bacterium]
MFELERLQGTGDHGIALQTRTGRDITNSVGVELSELHLRRYEALLKRCGQNWRKRRIPSGEYNCAGHVWASRRTCIYEEEDWRMIFREDGFRITEEPVPDDLVVYIGRENEGILHIGRVVELREGMTQESPRIAWVVSKWSDVTGEVFHFEHDHPFKAFGFIVSIEYWTDRLAI